MRLFKLCPAILVVAALLCFAPAKTHAVTNETLSSVVSVLPVWPGRAQGGAGASPGTAPEGSGVILRPGIIATAWHVVEPAKKIDVRLSDGRILPAKLIARDTATDIAILGVDLKLEPIEIAPDPILAQRVCSIGNAYGFGLSVTCGVVSALHVTNAGFNPVEDFVQTDAAANPGMSGGALVDEQGRLVGMVSAIFASKSDTNIGINFAVSSQLLLRVATALTATGEIEYPKPGWELATADMEQLKMLAAPVVRSVGAASPANQAGIKVGDLIIEIGERRTRTPRDAIAALAILSDETSSVTVKLQRDGKMQTVSLPLKAETIQKADQAKADIPGDCPHPAPVCIVRQAVFPISSFDPVASATRIGPSLLVTNRHVVGNRSDAIVHTPDGPRGASLVPSAFRGDLVLLEVSGLPENGYVPNLEASPEPADTFYAIGADVARQEVRVFDPGGLISGPAPGAEFGRLHVEARMQPGVSGGALVNKAGNLTGIAVGGGEGRFEAVPLKNVRRLLELRDAGNAQSVTRHLGEAFGECEQSIERAQSGNSNEGNWEKLEKVCAQAFNQGQLLKAGRTLARAGKFDGAQNLLRQAVEQVPNSINARKSLLVALQLSARFEEMTGHARWLMERAMDDPQSLRFAIQSGVWGNQPELAEEAYQALLKADPRQAQAARRFIDNAPPAPPAR